jgi:predicted anti-sigma-YlaC factor YlaD
MTHDEISELLGAYALDAVEPEERLLVEEHLADCPRCRAEVADHREVATLLAHGGSDAPAGLWDRIAGTLEAAPPRLDLAPVRRLDQARAARRRIPAAAGLLLGAAAAVLVVLLGVQVRDQDHRINDLQTALRDPLAPAFDVALDAPGSKVLELASANGGLAVRGAVTAEGVGYLRAASLPRLGTGRTYQLWGMNGLDLVSLGVLGERPTVIQFQASRFSGFAITEEDAPGVVRSSNAPVVAGRFTA